MHNKKKVPHSKKHRIILIGDSNIKGHASNLKSILSNNYDFYSITKPGSTTSELKESAKKDVRQLSHDDVIIINSGINDVMNATLATKFNVYFVKYCIF